MNIEKLLEDIEARFEYYKESHNLTIYEKKMIDDLYRIVKKAVDYVRDNG